MNYKTLSQKYISKHAIVYGMSRSFLLILCLVIMVASIVGIDLLFFRSSTHFWERLMVNIGIVLIFAAFVLRFLK